MLALMTYLNDMLQAVQGKISISKKQKVLRSLGVLIKLIGVKIIAYAPQVIRSEKTTSVSLIHVPLDHGDLANARHS